MIDAPARLRQHAATAMVVFMAVVLFLAHAYGDAADAWMWHAGTTGRAPWRLLTAHFAHLNLPHLAANALAAMALAWASEQLDCRRPMAWAAMISLFAVSAGLLIGPWPVAWYAGASGMLYGVCGWLCLRLALAPATSPRTLRHMAQLTYLLLVAKVLWSLNAPADVMGWLGFPTAHAAHLYGLVGGSLFALLRRAP